MLPPGKIDWILLVDAYHEFSDPKPMLARMKESLAPGGRVLLLEYRAEQDPATIPFPSNSNSDEGVASVVIKLVCDSVSISVSSVFSFSSSTISPTMVSFNGRRLIWV